MELNDKTAVTTICEYLTTLQSALRRYNRKLEPKVERQHLHWILNTLATTEGLSRQTPPKPVSYAPDVNQIIRHLVDQSYIETFASPTKPMLICLYINLVTDCASRTGGLLSTKGAASVTGLQWRDVDIWLRKDNEQSLGLFGRVKIHNLKGHKNDDGFFKGVPLTLAPPELAFEDAVRLLVSLRLACDVFEHVRPWQDIWTLKIPPDASELRIKCKMSASGGRLFTDSRANELFHHEAFRVIPKLGKVAGFKERLTK